MPAAIRLTIAGQRWTLRYKRSITHAGVPCDGLCVYAKKEIWIRSDLRGQELVDTVLHEIMHAAGVILDEEFVTSTAADMAAAVYHPRVRGRI